MEYKWLKECARAKRQHTISKLLNKSFNDWTVIGSDIDSKRRILCQCKCGTTSLVSYINLINGTSKGCKQCGLKRKINTMISRHGVECAGQTQQSKTARAESSQRVRKEWINNNRLKKFGNWTVTGEDIVNEKVQVECVCGIVKQIRIYKLTRGESKGCKKCGSEKTKKTLIDRYGTCNRFEIPAVAQRMVEKFGTPNPSSSAVIKEKIVQKFAEQEWRSSTEIEFINYIKSLGFNVQKSYIGGSNPKEIDVFIPEKNLYIEFNGDYWHSEKCGKDRHYHLNKTLGCAKQNNSHLIHVFESEWLQKPEIVKNFIKSKLERGVPIRASECEIRIIDKLTAYEFCQQNHLQGRPGSSILTIGLYYGKELMSVMTFSKPHRQNMGTTPHLSRYAIRPGYRIHGGLSKMSRYAYSQIGEFVTFVHFRLSDGRSYEKAGYLKLARTKPDYWYWDINANKTVTKQARKKGSVQTPSDMTEREHAENDGLTRIWDCGKIKLLYRI